ncbi:MAG TPA: hypothetical protein VIH61_05095, partial [Waddliaceae bacterium]
MNWWPNGFHWVVFGIAILIIILITIFHCTKKKFLGEKLSIALLLVIVLFLYGIINYDKQSGMTIVDAEILKKFVVRDMTYTVP